MGDNLDRIEMSPQASAMEDGRPHPGAGSPADSQLVRHKPPMAIAPGGARPRHGTPLSAMG